MKLLGYIELPEHHGLGGFDHAAVHAAWGRLYVAHTANNAVDVIDCASDRYLYSIPGLIGAAGTLVAEEEERVFTSNRGENSIGIFSPDEKTCSVKVQVGEKPNGLAYDPGRGLLLSANVGDPALPGSCTLSLVDVAERKMIASTPVPGRTRWTIYDAKTDAFYVNIADPALILVAEAGDPARIARTFAIPASGPHGLDLDSENGRLFCACDGKRLIALDVRSGDVQGECNLAGAPDVIFFNAEKKRLYAAIGSPGLIEIFDTETLKKTAAISTEEGAHTIGFDPLRQKVYAFLPRSHRAAVYHDAL